MNDQIGLDITYEEYLRTDYWRKYAQEIKAERGGACETCKSRVNLQVHHKKYSDEVGHSLFWRERERPDLMQTLCDKCHRATHGLSPLLPTALLAELVLEPWVTREDEHREFLKTNGLLELGEDLIADEEDRREMLMDMGLDPNDPDPDDLSPRGMETDADDDEEDDY